MTESENRPGEEILTFRRQGSESTFYDDNETVPALPTEEVLTLAPISRPQGGTEQMLYDFAYNPNQEGHPLQELAEALYVNGGEIPSETVSQLDGPIAPLPGVIESDDEGGLHSVHVKRAFLEQQIRHEAATAPKVIFMHDNQTV